jgi:hypothetical protein
MIRKLFNRWHNPAPEAPEMDNTAPLGSPEWHAAFLDDGSRP